MMTNSKELINGLNYELFDKIRLKANLEEVSSLLEKGAEVNAQDEKGNTALMWAIKMNCIDICRLLIKKDANVNLENKYGHRALMLAALWRYYDICKLLIECGANINDKDEQGFTALGSAAMQGDYNVCKLLLENGADLNAQPEYRTRIFMFAAMEGHIDLCSLLVKQGVDVGVKAKDGNTALMCAASQGHPDLCRLLLEQGADLSAQNKAGNTALTCVAILDKENICHAMLSHAIIIPNGTDHLFIVIRCLLNRLGVSKDVQYLIIAKLPLACLTGLMHCSKYPKQLRDFFVLRIADFTKKQLIPMMLEAQKRASTKELNGLLNPDLFEENFGKILYGNILKALQERKLHLGYRLVKEEGRSWWRSVLQFFIKQMV